MIVAGPCSLPFGKDQISPHEPTIRLARAMKDAGADVFRCKFLVGGVFPPPGGWEGPGWGPRGAARETFHEIKKFMPIACELRCELTPLRPEGVLPEHSIAGLIHGFGDVAWWWIPARQMQNYELVRAAASALRDRAWGGLMIKRAPYAR